MYILVGRLEQLKGSPFRRIVRVWSFAADTAIAAYLICTLHDFKLSDRLALFLTVESQWAQVEPVLTERLWTTHPEQKPSSLHPQTLVPQWPKKGSH